MAADADTQKRLAAERAVEFVEDGMLLGIGTGSTAAHFVRRLGTRVRAGLRVRGIPTSEATRKLCEQEGVPLLSFEDVTRLDLAIDGADEADAKLNLTKGGGGALLREKVVAGCAKRFLVIADESKAVEHLGSFPLPVEVIPFAWRVVADQISALGGAPKLRRNKEGGTALTDNANYILDCQFGIIDKPAVLARHLDAIAGVAEHGLFVNMASALIVGRADGTVAILKKR